MLLSARIFGRLLLVGLERGDAGVEVGQHSAVGFGEALPAASLGGGDQLQSLLALSAVLGQELRCRDEHRAGQTRVGVRAGLLDRASAIAVGPSHFSAGPVDRKSTRLNPSL